MNGLKKHRVFPDPPEQGGSFIGLHYIMGKLISDIFSWLFFAYIAIKRHNLPDPEEPEE